MTNDKTKILFGGLRVVKSNIQYYWSDAWLLLAIIYASSGGDATLERIIATGDAIEHAIFNPEELESGFCRLTGGSFIKEKDGVFSATDKVMKAYAKTTTPRRSIAKEMEDTERFLSAKSYPSVPNPENNLRYSEFSMESYERAVSKYIEAAGKYAERPRKR